MGITYNSPRIVTDNMVLCCDGANKRTFESSGSLVGIGESGTWNFANTATNYNSTLEMTYSPDLNLFAGVASNKYIVGSSGTDNKQVQTSVSGSGWVARQEAHPAQWSDICWGKDVDGTGKFVACAYTVPSEEGTSNKFMYSTTGISGWTSVSATGSSNVKFHSIGAGNSTFIAVGFDSLDNGEVWKSEYGSSGWSAKTPTANNRWYDVCWGDTGGSDGTWVAISYDGTDKLMYSTDNGDTWSNSGVTGFSANETWKAITYGKDKFVAVDQNGAVSYSANGINWTTKQLPSVAQFEALVYGGGYYVAGGGNYVMGTGNIWYSGNGIDWTSIPRVAGAATTSYSWSQKAAFGYNNRLVLGNSETLNSGSGNFGDLFGIDHVNRILYSDDLSTISGTTWDDLSPKNNNMTLHGPTFSEAEGFITFNGTYSYANILSNSDVAFGTGDFTSETWVKFSNLTDISHSICDTRSTVSSSDGLYVYALPIGTASGNWGVYTDGALKISGGSAVIDTWYHVVVTRLSGTTTLYVNGISIGNFSDSYNYTNDDMYVGKNIDNSHWLDGYIGLIRVYKGKGLSTNQVRQNFNSSGRRYI